ncbi:hypothetical protein Pst134EB_018092 [Puccinia striiformis f. sp. tritici]|nr:hypothetical protein Pst134EB_018092 [Puccinia striiformis f. sp. tritici]
MWYLIRHDANLVLPHSSVDGRTWFCPPKSTREQLVDIVKQNYKDSSQYMSDSAGSAQQVLQDTTDSIFFPLWTDSQLRDLLEYDVVSPNGKREELVRAAKRHSMPAY